MTGAAEVIYTLQALATLLVAIVGWFIKRTLDRLDSHLDEIDRRQDEHNGRIAQLEGWRQAVAPMHSWRGGRRGEP